MGTNNEVENVSGRIPSQEGRHGAGKYFTTTAVLEDNIMCGIEVAPSASYGATASTTLMVSDHSNSWSIATKSTIDSMACNTGAPPAEMGELMVDVSLEDDTPGQAIENYSTEECSPVYGRTVSKTSSYSTAELPTSNLSLPSWEETIWIADEYVNDHMTPSDELPASQPLAIVSTCAIPQSEEKQSGEIALYRSPSLQRPLSDFLRHGYHWLFRMTLCRVDVPELRSFVEELGESAGLPSPPFAVTKKMGSAVMVVHVDDQQIELLTNGQLLGLGQLFLDSRAKQQQNRAFFQSDGTVDRTTTALSQTQTSLHRPAMRIHVAERGRQRDVLGEIRKEANDTVSSQYKQLEHIHPGSPADSQKLLRDEELRSVMKRTRDGNDVSSLFPSFSDDSVDSCDASTDGLGEEIRALDDIEGDLRRELEYADIIIKGVTKQVASPTPFAMPVRACSYEEISLDMCSNDEIEKRVRFSEYNQEHVFIDYLAETEDDDESRGGSSRWGLGLEDVYVVMENIADGMSFACTTALNQRTESPPTTRETKLSTIFYF